MISLDMEKRALVTFAFVLIVFTAALLFFPSLRHVSSFSLPNVPDTAASLRLNQPQAACSLQVVPTIVATGEEATVALSFQNVAPGSAVTISCAPAVSQSWLAEGKGSNSRACYFAEPGSYTVFGSLTSAEGDVTSCGKAEIKVS